MCAYNYYCGGGDTVTAGRPRVKAGDMILVHAGTYKYHPEYLHRRSQDQRDDSVRRHLLPDRQRHAGEADRHQGGGRRRGDLRRQRQLQPVQRQGRELQLLRRRDHPQYRYRDLGRHAVHRRIEGPHGQALPLRKRRPSASSRTIAGSSNFYIADNYFFGRDDSKHLLGWNGAFWAQFDGVDGQKFPPVLASYTAVRLYGPGHVVAYNYVADFHDGIDVETYGNPDGSHAIDGPHYPPREYWDRRPVAIDFYNNYMTNFHDNAFEIDGSMHNVRVMRNMMVNSASHPFCNQPAIGGPIYWIRNIAYHAPGGSTRMTNGAAGVLFYNNTILTETAAGSSANVHWRNNLMLGENSAPAIFSVNTNTNYSSSDYNGFRPNPGRGVFVPVELAAARAPRRITPACCGRRTAANPSLEVRQFATLAEYSRATHQDEHSVAVDYDVFVNVTQAGREGSEDGAATLQGGRLRFPAQARLRGGGSRRGPAQRDRWIHGRGAGSGRAGNRPDSAALRTSIGGRFRR